MKHVDKGWGWERWICNGPEYCGKLLFFEKGSLYLEPLLQKDIANELDLTNSTVSRILSSKYVFTSFGTFPLKYLCPRNHFGKTKERLKLIIKEYADQYSSFSDEKLALLLKKDGIDIARRTVAKYRHLIGIKSSITRKIKSENIINVYAVE